jgi:Coenzyme PQQ synthesis protein D (PqqD)
LGKGDWIKGLGKEEKMNKKTYVARSPRIAARMLGEEMLVMSGTDSTLFTLNPTATILWQAADGATPLNEIVEHRICSRFEVKPEDAMRDAEELTENLARHGILVISEQPIPQAIGKADTPVQEHR